ncbi:hypothetical protein CUZ96_1022 [Enterococcus lactis]|nr:hypothetical protein HMPREF0352_2501 [Enterococcus faecium TX1330]EFF38373.1 hypothetical protein EfmE980_0625 [Enterococcus faecium E980]MBL4988388.1 hypothetical protein [Enterococcus lactis]SJX69034.1 hypothetical protein FM130_04545 [Enterococcus faecium]MBL4992482.1 hypothetical protein [Enterococcus lactis]
MQIIALFLSFKKGFGSLRQKLVLSQALQIHVSCFDSFSHVSWQVYATDQDGIR